ncbi:KI20B protein, partial [Ptilorrhoa leucosticta]|nr:KI20B protein [Ptilorrhoa leucosticta]
MEPTLDNEKFYRPSYIASIEPSPRAGPVSVEDIKTDLSSEFSLASSSSDTSQSKGHIQVCLRIRPFTSLERENGSQDCVSLEDSTNIVLKPPQHYLSRLSEKTAGQMLQKFTFSQVFGPETTQEEFFEGTMKQPVQDFLDGYNRLVFTYGVTNAGKTYTFQGTEDDVGILPRTMDMLFKSIQGKLYTAMDLKPYRCRDYIKLTENQVREETAIKNSLFRLIKELLINFLMKLTLLDLEDISKDSEQSITTARNYKFSVWVSFFEIYNECFYDLLIPISNDKKRKTLRLAQDIKGCSFVKDLQWVQISDSKEALRLLKLGLKHQSIASTKLNNCSSRSHSIFTVKVLKIEDSGTPRVTRVNELSLCDLAGSERYTKTRNEGDRLKESGNINTSLLTLGKCINALKNCQQSKLQQHIPFRESKLTHFLQGFFSGKGKVYMIVNISKCASAYEETLNVLKFSAIAQKVLVMDTSILPQDQSFGQKLAGESSLLNVSRMPIPRKRATILWDRTLEDVFEDDGDEMEEQPSMSREEAVQENEGNEVVIAKEKYMVCAKATLRMLVSLVEELRNKLITEKKNKLLLEIKIREEVIQEFTHYFAEREIDFKECLSHERAQLEENSEKRLEIFKELVNSYTKNADEKSKLQDRPCKNGTDTGAYIDFEGVIDSLQNDITDIKNQAEAAHQYIVTLEDPQETIGCLEKQLAKITAELVEIKEELEKKTKGPIVQFRKCKQLLRCPIKKNSNEVTESSQFKDCEEAVLEVGRKHCLENKPTAEEEPPTKKGTISTIIRHGSWENYCLDLKRMNNSETYMEIQALKERTEILEGHMAALEEQCQREKKEKEELNQQIASLQVKLSASEERGFGLSGELQQCRAEYQETVSELDKQKTINKEQEEKVIQLNNEVTGAKQNIIDKVSQIKAMQSQVGELYKCHSESSAVDIDSVTLKDSLDPQKDEPDTAQMRPLSAQFQTASTADLRQESSFHCSIESIWEECKIMIKASSQKSHQIQQLLQQVEDLEKRLYDSENCNNQLKIKLNEITDQDHQSVKEKDLMNQLREQIKKKTQDFENQAAEDQRVIAQFQEKVTSYEGKIRDLECLLEAFRVKDDSMKELEEELKERESTILNLESNTVALQEKCTSVDKKLKELNDREANLKDEVVQLMSSLETMKHILQEKEKNEYEQIQSIELLRKDLSERSALVQSLKKDLQRKEEEYTDLKEKFSDAKKQIQQVQKEVCTMQTQEKSLRKQVNELEKIKKQFNEELEFKQRTILQLKKQLNKEKLEEISKQYEKAHKDLCAKEKVIEAMRMTLEEQEQTQIEQDQVLEIKLEETNRLVLELEAWKQKYRELNNQCNSDWQQKMSKNEEKTINENEELIKLQKELKENEAKYQTDRKKWLEEKMGLINQVKEAENHRNREMRKFVEDREHHIKQQAEIERLAAQLVEKDSNLQKWREERDELVEALEVQLKTLASSNIQKDKEIEELKQAALTTSEKQINHENLQSLAEVPLPEEGQDKIDQSVNKEFRACFLTISIYLQDHSKIVLDSTEVSTKDGKSSRFPKPEMAIQFTPLQPCKMEVKHQGSTSPVTVKMVKPRRKRKSVEMNEDFVKSENKRNAKPAMADSPSTSNKKMMSPAQSLGKEYSLRRQESSLSKKSAKKKDGTLQKIGDFFQSSPIIIHSKAKKLIETISSPMSAQPENVKENELKPKRPKRKLYSTDISCPLDIPGSSILVEQKKKESDHLIIKRRLRSRIAK